ncbi:carboxypeptidase-like regulatory domain-containing protein [uncultured Algibacter sp.]|uniref:carboxypeptidase-like regulatory domain-containing protein n=1 Tax=uncultured Algibacter sp. TaxID=298659 RepID=UPI0026309345|nr:carboxypeptidase-like regulatory domain-containing protein [uncultured Algibacter sp.]
MRPKIFLVICFLSLRYTCISQTITGVVIDAKTKSPIETATVYFDNTTRGVVTNKRGQFSISYNEAVQSPLIVSFLGYKRQIITDYRTKNQITIQLKETKEILDEVIVKANDGLSRKQKLRLFRAEFLGTSKFGKSCKILNENDLVIRYHKKHKLLTANVKAPIKIENKGLQYLMTFDMELFEISFKHVDEDQNIFNVGSVKFIGNTYYQNLKNSDKKKVLKNRNKVYAGSRLEFMRALYAENLEDNDYQIFYNKLKTNPSKHFNFRQHNNPQVKLVTLNERVSILYNKRKQSSIEFLNTSILLDAYGNYTNVIKVRFSGAMSNQRFGDLLPFNFGIMNSIPN